MRPGQYFGKIPHSETTMDTTQPVTTSTIRTSIRKIVSFQISLGYLLLVVALNVFLAWQTVVSK